MDFTPKITKNSNFGENWGRKNNIKVVLLFD